MSASDFFDTNVLLYLASPDTDKAERAEAILKPQGWISVQVLNEFTSVAMRKFHMSLEETRDFLSGIREIVEILPLHAHTHDQAVAIAARHRLNIYDAMIVAAASEAGCDTLYTEDLQDGMRIEGLTVRNPFTP